MARRYLVLSDLHLCDVEEHADGWKAYKRRRYLFDDDIEALVQRFLDEGDADEERILVLNGDIIDFDVITAVPHDPPWPVSRRERKRGLDPDEDKSRWKLERVLEQHGAFVETLARFVAGGHQLVYVAGNHDSELHFPKVREAFLEALSRRARGLGLPFDSARVCFEPWFYYVPGEIYVEHGQQYDYYTSFRYILSPFVPTEPPRIALPMGNLSNRYLMTQMGFFNPHASDYILNIYRYLLHWLRYYAFSRRSIAINWFLGSLLVLARLLVTKRQVRRDPPDEAALLRAHAAAKGLPRETLEALDRLKRPPITNRVFRIIREFWIDRLLMALIMTGGTIALALVAVPLWVKLMVPLTAFPLFYFIYEEAVRGETIFSAEHEYPNLARRIAEILPTKVVALGHSHKPMLLPLGEGVTYVNTGTWAPIFRGFGSDELVAGLRNALLVFVHDDHAHVEFESLIPLANLPAELPAPSQQPEAIKPATTTAAAPRAESSR
jgi:UDP-2,3-diacylglucosamine pyrophosphatase LpxH